MQVVDPRNNQLVREHPDHDAAELERRVALAASAFASWSLRSFAERAAPMRRVAELLRDRRDALAVLMAEEMGKPVTQGLAEVEKCAWATEYFAEHAEALLADEPVKTEATRSYVAYRPLGVVLSIMPWNYPLWQVVRAAAPSLMAGNAMLLKHADNVPGCALALEALFRDAGFPVGVLQALLVRHEPLGALIDDRRVAAVTLTGSTRAGRAVAARAGHALKRTVLELGGSDPYVVLSDADVEHAATVCVAARLVNAGQSCIAAKRFIVEKSVRARFEELVLSGMRRAVVGEPREAATEVGPLARLDLRDALHDQVERTLARGASLLLGGTVPDRPGAWYPPTVLGAVRPGMPAFDEELFGPVAVIVEAEDDERAIRLANDCAFGLGAAVFTRDVPRGEWLARTALEAGACFVNASVRSDPRLPFGGVKDSGFGRELGALGIRELVNVKTVWVA
jgi:succinate-semialdehyde dehydrogenase / glutarate-semialdehyde dehydrogenase